VPTNSPFHQVNNRVPMVMRAWTFSIMAAPGGAADLAGADYCTARRSASSLLRGGNLR